MSEFKLTRFLIHFKSVSLRRRAVYGTPTFLYFYSCFKERFSKLTSKILFIFVRFSLRSFLDVVVLLGYLVQFLDLPSHAICPRVSFSLNERSLKRGSKKGNFRTQKWFTNYEVLPSWVEVLPSWVEVLHPLHALSWSGRASTWNVNHLFYRAFQQSTTFSFTPFLSVSYSRLTLATQLNTRSNEISKAFLRLWRKAFAKNINISICISTPPTCTAHNV